MLATLIEDLNTQYFCLRRKVSIKALSPPRGSSALLLGFQVRTLSMGCIIDRGVAQHYFKGTHCYAT